MSVVQDLLLYIVFNCVMGSFACFWSLSHYLCKWALCVVIKCSSAAEKCKWMGQTEQQVLVAPHGHAKPRSDSEATKGKVLHCDSSRRAFHFFFFSVSSVVSEHNELLHFVLYRPFDIPALIKNKIKQAVSTYRLRLTVTIRMCDFKNTIHSTQSLWVSNISRRLQLKVFNQTHF